MAKVTKAAEAPAAPAKEQRIKKVGIDLSSTPLWTEYQVKWTFLGRLCGSVPGDPNIIRKWLEARQPKVRPPGGLSIDEVQEEVLASIEAGEDVPVPGELVFQRNPENGNNLVLRSGTIRAHIKDCAGCISGYVGMMFGEKSFRTKILNCVYLDETEYWIPIKQGGRRTITEPTGRYQKPIHVTTKMGPQNSIKDIEFVTGASIEFRLKVMFGVVPYKDLQTLFFYGGTHGYGGERSDGEGRYTFEIVPAAEATKEMGNGKKKTNGGRDRRQEVEDRRPVERSGRSALRASRGANHRL